MIDFQQTIRNGIKDNLETQLVNLKNTLESLKIDLVEVENKDESGYDIAKAEVVEEIGRQKLRIKEIEEQLIKVMEINKVIQIGDIVTLAFLKYNTNGTIDYSAGEEVRTYQIAGDIQENSNIEVIPLHSELVSKLIGQIEGETINLLEKHDYPTSLVEVKSIVKSENAIDVIGLNSLVGLWDIEFEEMEWYYVLSSEGGYSIDVDMNGSNVEVFMINPKAPLCKAILGRKVSDVICFRLENGFEREVEVKEIY